MADPLLAKLDRLMRQMERGQLLEDDQLDDANGKPGGKRRAQRRPRQTKPFKNWNSSSTSYKLPEHDACGTHTAATPSSANSDSSGTSSARRP